nr:glycine-rich cell wall structural protein 1.0-like [Arachis hypogaea]
MVVDGVAVATDGGSGGEGFGLVIEEGGCGWVAKREGGAAGWPAVGGGGGRGGSCGGEGGERKKEEERRGEGWGGGVWGGGGVWVAGGGSTAPTSLRGTRMAAPRHQKSSDATPNGIWTSRLNPNPSVSGNPQNNGTVGGELRFNPAR